MFQNYQVEENLSNQTNSLDMDSINKTYNPKALNNNEKNKEKSSCTGTSISSANRIKDNESYNNFISKIKLNYNLMHPRQRIQTIILHSNLDKSINMSDSSFNDLSGNVNNNLNTGFILDNSGRITTNEYKNNKRNTLNHLNRIYDERLQKGEEEEKNNQSAEAKKNKYINFNNNYFDKNNNDNSRINLGRVFNNINDETENDKVYLSKNGFIDNQQWTKKGKREDQNNNEKIPSSSYMLQNNPFLGISQNEFLGKEGKSMDMNHISNNMNNLSTNMNTNSTNDEIFQYGKGKKNEKEIISSFNYGINNMSNNSLPFSRRSFSHLGSQLSENINKSENDNIGTKFTFRGNEENDNKYLHRNSLPTNYPQNKIFNNYNNNISENEYFQNNNDMDNTSKNNNLYRKPKEINSSEQLYYNNDEKKNNRNLEDDIKYAKLNNNYYLNNNRQINPKEKENNVYTHRNNNNINKEGETDDNLALTITDLDENEIEDKKYRKKGKNCLKSFLYGLLFGSAATGIYCLENEETRKYFLEKIKKINFNSIINFFKKFFSNPITFFKKIFNNERMKDYIKVFGIAFGNFFDFFERYEDWFRFIGIILCVYLIWIIFKSFFKAFFKVWKQYN